MMWVCGSELFFKISDTQVHRYTHDLGVWFISSELFFKSSDTQVHRYTHDVGVWFRIIF